MFVKTYPKMKPLNTLKCAWEPNLQSVMDSTLQSFSKEKTTPYIIPFQDSAYHSFLPTFYLFYCKSILEFVEESSWKWLD